MVIKYSSLFLTVVLFLLSLDMCTKKKTSWSFRWSWRETSHFTITETGTEDGAIDFLPAPKLRFSISKLDFSQLSILIILKGLKCFP